MPKSHPGTHIIIIGWLIVLSMVILCCACTPGKFPLTQVHFPPSPGPGEERREPSAPVGKIPDAFSVSTAGEALYSLSLWVPPGRAGLQPDLYLQYASRGGDGQLGIRWSLGMVSSITRVGANMRHNGRRRGLAFDEEDFFALDGNRLETIDGHYGEDGTEYLTKKESFCKVVSHSNGNGVWGFTVYRDDGRIWIYGAANEREAESTGAVVRARDGVPRAWMLRLIKDRHENYIEYDWTVVPNGYIENWDGEPGEELPPGEDREHMEVFLSRIEYTGNFAEQLPPKRRIEFRYRTRTDTRNGFLAGIRTRTGMLLHRIDIYAESISGMGFVRRYHLNYETTEDPFIQKDYLSSVEEVDAEGVAKPPTRFDWIGLPDDDPFNDFEANSPARFTSRYYLTMDVDTDGFSDLVYLEAPSLEDDPVVKVLMNAGSFTSPRFNRVVDTGIVLDGTSLASFDAKKWGFVLDYDLDGHQDILLNWMGRDNWHVLLSDGSDSFNLRDTDVPRMARALDGALKDGVSVADFNGDGLVDVLEGARDNRELPGADERWNNWYFRPLTEDGLGEALSVIEIPAVHAGDRPFHPLLILDENGDGVSDMLFGYAGWLNYMSCTMVDEGSCQETDLPKKPYRDYLGPGIEIGTSEHKLTIDVNGDGLKDVLHIFSNTLERQLESGIPRLLGGNLWINTGRGFIGGPNGLQAFEGVDFWERLQCLLGNAPCDDRRWELVSTAFDMLDFRGAVAADFNHDGREDLVVASVARYWGDPSSCAGYFCGKWHALYANNQRTYFHPAIAGRTVGIPFEERLTPLLWDGHQDFLVPRPDPGLDDPMGYVNPTVLDYNGDLLPDILYSSVRGSVLDSTSHTEFFVDECWPQVILGRGEVPENIHAIRDGLIGMHPWHAEWDDTATWFIHTRPTTDTDVYTEELPVPADGITTPPISPQGMQQHPRMFVVESYTRDNGLYAPPLQHFFTYHDSRFDRHWGWLGFRAVQHREPAFSRTTTALYEKMDDYVNESLTRPAYPVGFYPFGGLLTKRWTDTSMEDGTLHRELLDQNYQVRWTPQPGIPSGYRAWFNFLQSRDFKVQECDHGTCATEDEGLLKHSQTRHSEIDRFGNVGRTRIEYPELRVSWEENVEYATDESLWLVRMRDSLQRLSSTPNGHATQSLAYGYDLPTGRLEAVVREPDDADRRLETRFSFDELGLLRRSWQQDGNGTIKHDTLYAYETGEASFIEDIQRFRLDPATGDLVPYHETHLWDTALGRRTFYTDPNGTLSAWTYDGFGRLRYRYAPFGIVEEIRYDDRESVPGHRQLELIRLDSNGAESHSIYDRLARPVQEEGFIPLACGGRLVSAGKRYGPQGLLAHVDLPHCPYAREFGTLDYGYDALGRHILTTSGDGRSEQTIYEGRDITVIDPQGDRHRYQRNELGQVTSVINGEDSDAQSTNHYLYGAFGSVRHITDAEDNLTSLTMDPYGRLLSIDDPDRGVIERTYTPFGELETITDALGTISFEYDHRGRLLNRLDNDGETNWRYDQRRIDALTWRQSPWGHREDFFFQPDGMLNRHELQVDGATFTRQYDYTTGGLLNRYDVYDGGLRLFSLRYLYESGELYGIDWLDHSEWPVERQEIFRLLERDAYGRMNRYYTGNKVTTTLEYDPVSGWLSGIQSENANGLIQNLAYAYYDDGNLRERRNELTDVTQHFQYDALDRLDDSRIWIDGIDQGLRNFDYDRIGNLVEKHDEGTYNYDATQSHAVSSIEAGLPGVSQHFRYDDLGRMSERYFTTPRDDFPHNAVNYSYTRFNKPLSFRQERRMNLEFEYMADQARAVKRRSTSTGTTRQVTLYAGEMERRQHLDVGGSWFYKLRVDTGERLAAVLGINRTETMMDTELTRKVDYVHEDNLGSPHLITDENGDVLEEFVFDEFGSRRRDNWAGDLSVVDPGRPDGLSVGYTAREADDEEGFGLTNMLGREYDSRLGRFLTPDPIIPNPLDTQSYNRYSYALNNPLTLVDPSGFNPAKPPPRQPVYTRTYMQSPYTEVTVTYEIPEDDERARSRSVRQLHHDRDKPQGIDAQRSDSGRHRHDFSPGGVSRVRDFIGSKPTEAGSKGIDFQIYDSTTLQGETDLATAGYSPTTNTSATDTEITESLQYSNSDDMVVYYGHTVAMATPVALGAHVPFFSCGNHSDSVDQNQIISALTADADPPSVVVFAACGTASLARRSVNVGGVRVAIGIGFNNGGFDINFAIRTPAILPGLDRLFSELAGGSTFQQAFFAANSIMAGLSAEGGTTASRTPARFVIYGSEADRGLTLSDLVSP